MLSRESLPELEREREGARESPVWCAPFLFHFPLSLLHTILFRPSDSFIPNSYPPSVMEAAMDAMERALPFNERLIEEVFRIFWIRVTVISRFPGPQESVSVQSHTEIRGGL